MFLLVVIVVSRIVFIRMPGKGDIPIAESDSVEVYVTEVKPAEKKTSYRKKERDTIVIVRREVYSGKRTSNEYRKQSVTDGDTVNNTKTKEKDTKRYISKQAPLSPVDINAADSLTLTGLPGIGPYYASRILQYRDRLGGFASVTQLREIDVLPDSLMKWFIVSDTIPLKLIMVNGSTLAELRRHPYLDFYQARAIIEFRRERGNIKGPEQLSFMEEFTEQDLVRLKPYLDFN